MDEDTESVKVMELKALVMLLLLGSGPAQSSLIRKFKYKSSAKTWSEAREYCRSKPGGDLATFVSDAELSYVDLTRFEAWFGLKKVDSAWQWRGGALMNHDGINVTNWFQPGEPNERDDCARVIYSQPKVLGQRCNHKYFIFCEEVVSSTFHLIPEGKTWEEGLESCRNGGQNYMVFPDEDDLSFDDSPINEKRDFPVWTGLHEEGGTWRWSDRTHSPYRNWAAGSHPSAPDPGMCVAISSQTKFMSVHDCSKAFPYLCYTTNLVLVPERLSWERALEHCWTIGSSGLFTFSSQEAIEEVQTLVLTTSANTKVWVGLRFLAGSWFWSDGSPLSWSSLSACPEFHCGALDLDSGSIQPRDCSEELSPICSYQL